MAVMPWHGLKWSSKQWRGSDIGLRALDWGLQFWLPERWCQNWSPMRMKSFWSPTWPLFIPGFFGPWDWAHWNDIGCSAYGRLVSKWLQVDPITWNARNGIGSAERYYQLIFVRAMILVIKLLLTRAKTVDWESRLKPHRCGSRLM